METFMGVARAGAVHAFLIAGAVIMSVGQENPLSWLPLQVGNRWIYDHEWKAGSPQNPEITAWTTEETITAIVSIPEGLVAVQDVKATQGRPSGGWVAQRGNSGYLVRDNCIYLLTKSSVDNTTHQLSSTYRQDLANGILSPDLCFPLEIKKQWDTADVPWRIEGRGDPTVLFLPPKYADAFDIRSDHLGSGGLMNVWFQKGIGIVSERYLHQGTHEEWTKRLKAFIQVRQIKN